MLSAVAGGWPLNILVLSIRARGSDTLVRQKKNDDDFGECYSLVQDPGRGEW